ncbi:unnamed protein product [Rotaria sordida]|uniref:Potassium channel domain-containing protein n=1 Tax=Rotaria sordida TaxID=392033 RepID=A0A814SH18_9BILA|nr:unnamed protein product [Rotaria sordida]
MHSSVPLLEFDKQGDIHLIQSSNKSPLQCQCVYARYILHQISLIVIVLIYLIVGGLFFAFIESKYYLKKDDERKEIISETYEHIRSLAIHLLNEQLNENFENAYQQWRWNNEKLSNYIYLNNERANILDNQTEFELENLSLRLAMRQVAEEKFVYKWTYSTAILYAATLVTTIGYGNISPKTTLGKISTVIYALIGILLVVSWLKLVGDSLALLVTQYYQYFNRCFRRHFKRKKIPLQEKIYLDEKVPFWVPITLLILYLLAGSILFATWEGWSYIDSAYFSFITFTTIGFGDLVPGETTITHRNGRSLICAIYLLFGVMLTALSFKLIQEDIDRIKSCLFQRLVISKSDAGPPPIPGKSITAKQLAAAFTFVHDPKVQSAALKISSAFHHEHGCENAVRLFHTNLSLSKMHSDLESSFSACFRLKDYNLQISRPVAQVLVAAEAIEESQLTLLATHDWNKSMYVNRLESYASGFRRAISRFADSVRPSKRSSSVNYLERNSSCSTPHITKHNLINVGRPFKDNLPLYGDIKEQPPQEEYDENSKLAEKVKRGVHYDLPPTIVKKSSVHNRSRSTADAIPSSTINHFRKNNSKSRTTDNILPNSPYQNQRTRNIHSAKTNKKKQDLVLPKQKPILQLKDKNNSTSTEQKAADISGLSIDVCKKILADFKQIQSARRRSIDKSKHQMGISILPNSHRRRSQSSIVH